MFFSRAPPIDGLLDALDSLRRASLRASGPVARALIAPRAPRVALSGSIAVALAFAAVCVRPLWMLAFGPLLWGVPHLVSDVRYLVARPRLHRRAAAIVACSIAAIGLAAGLGVRAGLAAAAIAALGARSSLRRRLAIATAFLALLAAASFAPWHADVVFVQAHNLLAIAIWIAWRRRSALATSLPLAAFAAGAALIFFGPVASFVATSGGLDAPFTGLTVAHLGETLAFGVGPATTLRFVLFFAFAQSVHYVVWLRLVPEDDRARPTPRSFAQSFRALERDLGPQALWLALVVAAAIVAVALSGLVHARDAYLGVAYFHGYLELIAIALLGAERSLGKRPS